MLDYKIAMQIKAQADKAGGIGIPLLVVNPDKRKVWSWQCNNCPRADGCGYLAGRLDPLLAVSTYPNPDGGVAYACRIFMRELTERLEQRGRDARRKRCAD